MKNKQKCHLPPYIVDPIISLQAAQQKIGWNITAFNLPVAWKQTRGEGVKVAILDSGCDLDHPDLKKNLLISDKFFKLIIIQNFPLSLNKKINYKELIKI